ncbi:sugar ABC transporter substrate-binding protein [Mariniluteicoccus endophyticus]
MTTNFSRRSALGALAGIAAAAVSVTACSPAQQQGQSGGQGGSTTVTVRVWDEQVAKAYEQSFAEFSKKNPGITVKVTTVPYSSYFDKLRTDMSGGQADDIFMINGSYIEPYIKNNNILEIGGEFAPLRSDWVPAAVEQYTYSGKLMGVPQLTDGGIALYYNKELLAKAGLKPEDISSLVWSPDGSGDTLTATAKKLTVDAAGKSADDPGFDGSKPGTWGYSAAQDLQGIYYNFLGSNGGAFQDKDNNFTFASPEGVQAFEYLVKLINTDKVSPDAANTNSDGDFTRDQFLQGKIAMFQSGVYNLKNVADGAKFEWGIVPMPKGPKGAVSVVNSVVVCGNAGTKNKDATLKVLQWLGSKDGASFIGSTGAALPAVSSAQPAFQEFWKGKNVDPSLFAKAGQGQTTRPPAGPNYSAAFKAWKPTFDEIFLGRTPVAEGLKKAQDDANKAMKG